MLKSMGDWYDFSELPTVAYKDGKPVVLDGNRRVLIGKILLGHVTPPPKGKPYLSPSALAFPDPIDCNVCDWQTGLATVDRKHGASGTWDPLERDIFRHQLMGKQKTLFIILEEATKMISSNKELNQGFVKKEVFTKRNLEELGFSVKGGDLSHGYQSETEAQAVLRHIETLVNTGIINTRSNRGKVVECLTQEASLAPSITAACQKTTYTSFGNGGVTHPAKSKNRKTRIGPKPMKHAFWGGTLSLKPGIINDLYSDLSQIYQLSQKRSRISFSHHFPVIIRMGLRMIVEWAIQDLQLDKNLQPREKKFTKYVNLYYDNAKRNLSSEMKITLRSYSVDKPKVAELLNDGAHAHIATINEEQTLALSLIVGKMLEESHGLSP